MIAERLQQAFGEQVLGCYLTGSHVDGTAVSGSDIDLMVVLPANSQDKAAITEFCKALGQESSIHIDLEVVDEAALGAYADPVLKLGSQLLFGKDIRDQLVLTPIDEWARDRLHTSYWRSIKLFNRPVPVALPLGYPNPDDEFYGYVISGNTRNLVRHVSWAATALIAHLGKRYVVRKSDFVRLYRETVNDEYSDYLQAIYEQCKLEWGYQIPDEREHLRALCAETLRFENHFMQLYKAFLLQELQSAVPDVKQHAMWVQQQLPLQDKQVQFTLQ